MASPLLTCPKCGSTDIRAFDLVPVPYHVESFTLDGEPQGNYLDAAWVGVGVAAARHMGEEAKRYGA